MLMQLNEALNKSSPRQVVTPAKAGVQNALQLSNEYLAMSMAGG